MTNLIPFPRLPALFRLHTRSLGLLALVLASNLFTYLYSAKVSDPRKENRLYLMELASKYVYSPEMFEKKVRSVSRQLHIAPEWLMAVMHSESGFDGSSHNRQGSGATGLIQFMPATAKTLNITTEKLRNMNHQQQLEYVGHYLQEKRQKYGDFESLTDVYLAILYPVALQEEYCYTMYADPSVAYKQNKGLDQDKDGKVTVQDIDQYLKHRYPTAYMASKPSPTLFEKIWTDEH